MQRIVLTLIGCCLLLQVQAQDYYQQAQAETDNRRKVELYTKALAQKPTSEAYFYRAWAFCGLGYYDQGRTDFERGRSTPGSITPASHWAGMAYADYQTQQYARAEAEASQAIALSNTYEFAYRYRALARQQLHQLPAAEADADLAVKYGSTNAWTYYTRAGVRLEMGKLEPALADINDALKLDPEEDWFLQRKLLLLDKLGRKDEVDALAVRITKSAYKKDDPLSLSNLGVIFQNYGEYAAAERYHSAALRLYNQKLEADNAYKTTHADEVYQIYINRGDCYHYRKEYNKALGDFVKARDLYPERFLAHNRIGNLQTNSGNYREAIDPLETSFRINPSYTDGWVNLGFAYSQIGNRPMSIRTYDRALQVKGIQSKGLILNNRGFCYLELKQYDRAYADLTAAITEDPTVAMSHISLGEYYIEMKQYDQAMAKFNHALSMPVRDLRETWVAHYRRGQVLALQQKWEQAVADFRQAAGTDPQYADAHEQLGLALMELKRYCEAYASFKQAVNCKARMDEDKEVNAALLMNRASSQSSTPCN